MAQRSMRGRRYRQVVQFQFVPLLAVDVVQHFLQHLVGEREREGESDIEVKWLKDMQRRECSPHTSMRIVNCSRFSEGFTVCGRSEGMTRVAIIFTDNPYRLSLSMIR